MEGCPVVARKIAQRRTRALFRVKFSSLVGGLRICVQFLERLDKRGSGLCARFRNAAFFQQCVSRSCWFE